MSCLVGPCLFNSILCCLWAAHSECVGAGVWHSLTNAKVWIPDVSEQFYSCPRLSAVEKCSYINTYVTQYNSFFLLFSVSVSPEVLVFLSTIGLFTILTILLFLYVSSKLSVESAGDLSCLDEYRNNKAVQGEPVCVCVCVCEWVKDRVSERVKCVQNRLVSNCLLLILC